MKHPHNHPLDTPDPAESTRRSYRMNPMYPDYGGQYDMYATPGHIWENPRRLIRLLLTKWLTLTLCLILAVTLAFTYLTNATPIYQARSLVELSIRRPRIVDQQVLAEDPATIGFTDEIFNTRLQRFRGRTTMQTALAYLLADDPRALLLDEERDLEDDQAYARQLGRLMGGVDLSMQRNTRILQITFQHPDRYLAAAICNAVARAIETTTLAENRSTSDAAVAWLNEQEAIQREALQEADRNLLAFVTESNVNSLASQRASLDAAMITYNESLVDIESQKTRHEDLFRKLDEMEITPEEAADLPSFIPRAEELRTILSRWQNAMREREQLRMRYTARHPDVLAAEQLITLNREQASQTIREIKQTTLANRDLLVRQAASLRRNLANLQQQAEELDVAIATGQNQIAALERMREAADQTYRGLLARIQDARLAADENTTSVTTLEPASLPNTPVSPQRNRILALAVMLGLGGGVGFIILREILADHINDIDDFNQWGLGILALVPRVSDASRSDVATASLKHKFSQITEAFAGLRAMLDAPQHKDKAQVVLIASSLPAEGKTVTSCNLASAWARKGRSVLLLDFDLRRPQIAGIFPMPEGQTGLLEALATNPNLADGSDIAYPADDCPQLHIIATRSHPDASPAEISGTAAVERLIAWARENYDHVIIDAPPLGLVSDTLALAPLADSVLVMVRPSVSRKRITLHTIQRLQDAGIQNLALVANDVDLRHFGYGSYSKYYNYYDTPTK